jgi:hypothetical protein
MHLKIFGRPSKEIIRVKQREREREREVEVETEIEITAGDIDCSLSQTTVY